MNFLSPDDIFSGVRRKSLCNGTLLTLTNKHTDSAHSTPSKSKKERRRGSFNEMSSNAAAAANGGSGNGATTPGNGGRRASLVSRWFKHISDAAEQYKPRSKSNTNNQEPVDDPAIATIPHSNTKESLEPTPERPPPMSATATVTTTPLAPMLPVATVTPPAGMSMGTGHNNNYNDVQLRNGRRESTPVTTSDNGGYYNLGKQRLSHNELSSAGAGSSLSAASAVNRTMSTRSCGEANNNYAAGGGNELNGVTLRHTQSARQANGQSGNNADYAASDPHSSTYSLVSGGLSKRDSASIVCSNNSNNTRTLLMQSPLVDPTQIQISISPAHTAEPVLTPSEKLRRLDASIRDGLLEKQKIICDMFRLPVEHFNEIVDIAAMPEAPKDSADIALAAYDQVQTLTKVLNEYMQVTPEQEISAVSTAVCDHCHEKQQQRKTVAGANSTNATAPTTSASSSNTSSSSSSSSAHSSSVSSSTTTVRAETPPPLPPPNKQPAQQQTPAKNMPKLQTPMLDEQSINIHEDDDGYCEIDELRLPALPNSLAKTTTGAGGTPVATTPTTPLAPFKVPMTPATPPANATPAAPTSATTTQQSQAASNSVTSTTPELIKRQSTISADSIPEESADEVSKAMDDGDQQSLTSTPSAATTEAADVPAATEASTPATTEGEQGKDNETADQTEDEKKQSDDTTKTSEGEAQTDGESATTTTATSIAEPQRPRSAVIVATADEDELTEMDSDFIEIKDVYNTLAALNKAQATLSMIDNSTQTQTVQALTNGTKIAGGNKLATAGGGTCGPNRIQHANALEPSVPCYALSNIVSVLNEQISLLLPKINERDMERERLRKENQHLRELLNAMHERQRVASKGETPTDIKTILSAADEAFDDEIDGASNTSVTPTPTPLPSTPTASPTIAADAIDSTTTTITTPTIEAEN